MKGLPCFPACFIFFVDITGDFVDGRTSLNPEKLLAHIKTIRSQELPVRINSRLGSNYHCVVSLRHETI